jgi:hypothetical protein
VPFVVDAAAGSRTSIAVWVICCCRLDTGSAGFLAVADWQTLNDKALLRAGAGRGAAGGLLRHHDRGLPGPHGRKDGAPLVLVMVPSGP